MNNQPADIFGFALERISRTDLFDCDPSAIKAGPALRESSNDELSEQDVEDELRKIEADLHYNVLKRTGELDSRRIEAGEKKERDNVLFGGGR
jgi:hypothetical protein